ncbi:MAG: hypothetical protein J3K34DRAFT_433787 [Monoraphidium minutum]|nr:MAG: hypothetical protein J3K34DRAFT_433787 [Monoraphidium minutum]
MGSKAICALLMACLAVAGASRGGPAANDLCSECTFAVRALKDMMCDPSIEGTVVDWVVDNICASTGSSKQQCADIVAGVAPALFDWLRLGTDAEEMCSEVGVCGTRSLFAPQAKPRHMRSQAANDMTCPLCMFVVGKVKEQLADPLTREAIHERTHAACGMLPAGGMRDTCTQWADKYEDSIFALVDGMEAEDLCALLGSCSLAERLGSVRLPPLSAGAVAALAPVNQGLRAAPANDNCEACKVVVAQMHSALANPDMQAQIVDYAKAVCTSMGSFSDACKEHVDQYAPMAFGMVLTYLQPESVCRQLHMCPPPSLATQLLSSLSGALFPDRFGGALLLQGRPMAAPGDALRLPRT